MACGSSIFDGVPPLNDAFPVFGINQRYKEDQNPDKVNLSIGVYRDEENKPWLLPVVAKVEGQLAQGFAEGKLNYEYLPIAGYRPFCEAVCKMLLGRDNPALVQNRAFGVQAVSGVGSLRLGFDFLKKFHCSDVVYISKPTWVNHTKVANAAGFGDVREYSYLDSFSSSLNFTGLCKDLENAPEHSIVVLQSDGHNPTGYDPTQAQWKTIADIMKKRKLFPFFDTPYQGFISGDPDVDAFAVRYFVDQGFELFVAQSFSKNFGLYNERVGNLCVVTSNCDLTSHILNQMKALIRPMWSNPPSHGALIVATILNDPVLYQEWRDNLRTMANRLNKARKMLYEKLKEFETPGNWSHIIEQKGMFSFTGLNVNHVKFLIQKHIYLLENSRISISGVNSSNVNYIAKAIHEAVSTIHT